MIKKEVPFIPIIVGGDISAYTIARNFHMEYQVKSIVISRALIIPIRNSNIIDNIIEEQLNSQAEFMKTLIAVAQNIQDKKLILIGCGDWYVKKIIENKTKLSQYYIIPYDITVSLMNQLINKDTFYQLCYKLNVDYPQTYIYDCQTKKECHLPFNYPVFVKPADVVSYHHTSFLGKKKGYKFDDEKSLMDMINNINKSTYDGKLIIQEYIPGQDANMRVLTCYCDKQAKVKMLALGHVLLEEHTPGSIGNHAAITNTVNEELFEQARKILEAIKYVGFAHFDIKYDPRDGKYKFFEINLRLGRNHFYITAGGCNPVKLLVDEYIYNKQLPLTIVNGDHLNLIVPKAVLLRYLLDSKLKKRVKQLIKKKKVYNPLIYKADSSIQRKFFVYLSLLNQIRKYYKYYPVNRKDTIKEKYVGVLGGPALLATVHFMNEVISNTQANRNQDHVNMLVLNHPSIPDIANFLLNQELSNPIEEIINDVKNLTKQGISFIVIPCNMTHAFYRDIQSKVSVPIINMVEETILYILKENPQIKKVGILAGDAVINAGFYQEMMQKYGIKCLLPASHHQQQIMDIINDKIKAPSSALKKIIKAMAEADCEKIILGSTTLVRTYKQSKSHHPKIVDPITILAKQTILLSGKQVKID